MIYSLENTTTQFISKKLVELRESGGQVTTGRVLTLVVVAYEGDDIESIITATAEASREHPSRVLVVVASGSPAGPAAADDDVSGEAISSAEIRVGGHAGASEIVVMRLRGEACDHLACVVTPLLLPDTPVVVWWPGDAPNDVAGSMVGRLSQRRITNCRNGQPGALYVHRNSYAPGDSDISWARLTPWRGVLASAMDQPPHGTVTRVAVFGPDHDPAVDIAAGWLADRFGITVERHSNGASVTSVDDNGHELIAVTRTDIEGDDFSLRVDVVDCQTIRVTASPTGRQSLVAVTHRSLAECLAEELRHLEPDDAYGRALRGLNRVSFVDMQPNGGQGAVDASPTAVATSD